MIYHALQNIVSNRKGLIYQTQIIKFNTGVINHTPSIVISIKINNYSPLQSLLLRAISAISLRFMLTIQSDINKLIGK